MNLSNELRVGNYILIDLFGLFEWHKVQPEDIKTIHDELFEAKPIELTEDILLKCGFIKHTFESGMIGYIAERWVIYLADNWKPCSLRYNVDDWYYPKIAEFNHLHQLQNLYYALTGTELEITL